MRLKSIYLWLALIFYLSIPVFWDASPIAMLLKGYAPSIAFLDSSVNDTRLITLYYAAYHDSFAVALYIAWICEAIWVITFATSVLLLLRRKVGKELIVPYKLDIITAIFSFSVIVLLGLVMVFYKAEPMVLL